VIYFDFSVGNYVKAYGTAKNFFERLEKETSVKQIIYVTGNHDATINEMVRQDLGIKNTPPRDTRHAILCRIDKGVITVDGTDNPNYNIKFLSDQYTPSVPWIVCTHLVIDEYYLAIHSHELYEWGESAWALKEILGYEENFNIEKFYEFMHIMLSATSTALHDSGDATKLIREFQEAFNSNRVKVYMPVVKRALNYISKRVETNWFTYILKKQIVKYIIKQIKKASKKSAKRDDTYVDKNRLNKYSKLLGLHNPYLISGHTHNLVRRVSKKQVNLGAFVKGSVGALYTIDFNTKGTTYQIAQ